MAGEEFASALIRFEIEDRQFQDGLKRIESATRTAAANADKAFREVGKSKPIDSVKVDPKSLGTAAVGELGTVLGSLDPKLGAATRGVTGLATGALGMSTGIGAAVVGFQLLSDAVAEWIKKAQEAIEFEAKLAQGFNTLDPGPAKAALVELAKETELNGARARKALDAPFSLGGLVAMKDLFFSDVDAMAKKAEQARGQLRLFDQVFEIPKIQEQAAKELLGATAGRLKFEQDSARTGNEILANLKARVDVIRQTADLEEAGIRREARLAAAKAQTPEKGAAILKAADDNIKALRSIADTQVAVETAAARKAAAEVEAIAAEHQARLAAIRTQGLQDSLRSAQALADTQRALADDRAKFEGRSLEGLGAFQAGRRENAERQIAARLLAIDNATAAERATLQRQIESEHGEQAERRRAQLTEVTAKGEAERTKALAEATVQRVALEQKEAQERQAAARQALAAAELDLRRAKLAGTATIADEIANLRAAANSGDLDTQTRITKAEEAKTRLAQVDQQYFNLRRALGQASLVDEVRRSAEIVDTYRRGTQARLDAETDLAAKTKQLREQAASAGESLLQKAASRLQARGIGEATLGDLQQEIADMKTQANEALANLRFGGNVDLGSLGDTFAAARQNGQLKDLGVTATQATNTAVGSALDQLGTSAPKVPSIFSTDAAQAENATASVSRIADSYARSFDGILKGTDDFVAAFMAKIESGNSVVADALFDNFMTKVVRRLQDEARRQ